MISFYQGNYFVFQQPDPEKEENPLAKIKKQKIVQCRIRNCKEDH